MDMKPAEMVALYIKLRDFKKAKQDALKKELEKTEAGMEKLEGLMLAHLDESGATSIACAAGTVYRKVELSATIEDKVSFENWLLEQDDFSAVDLKANKTFIKDKISSDGVIPPGIKVTQVASVGVQRK